MVNHSLPIRLTYEPKARLSRIKIYISPLPRL
ncbi:hypothetical protein [Caudoviricetes sp.]|nr:hypothetical protein [Caudoviricetes sp.]